MKNIKIGDFPEDERPFEKYKKYGISSLSDAEVLALILRTGTRKMNCINLCKEIIKIGSGSLAGLYGKTEKELEKIDGVGPVKATEIVCICELARRISRSRYSYDTKLDTAEKISKRYMEEMRHLREEHVLLLLLDIKFRLIKEVTISIGSVNQSILRPREVLVQAIKYEAVNLVLMHNHPSGDPTPSNADIAVTKKIIEATKIIGIPLVDHVIIGDCCYVSLRESDIVSF